MAVANGEIWGIKLLTRKGNQLGINILHYVSANVQATGPLPQEVAVAMDNAFAPVYKPAFGVGTTWLGTIASRVHPLPPGFAGISVGNQGPGSALGAPLPDQVSGVITKRTNFGGRSFRGRVYVPFPTANFDSGDGIHNNAAYATVLNAIGAALLVTRTAGAAGLTADFLPVIFHRSTKASDFVTSFLAKTLWGTQRRRGAYGALNPQPV